MLPVSKSVYSQSFRNFAHRVDNFFFVILSDESTRSDRQPEFTQLDIELSFTDRDHIMKLVENILTYCWPDNSKLVTPFERITYDEAMENYGSDKPDTRFDLKVKKNDLTYIVRRSKHFLCINFS